MNAFFKALESSSVFTLRAYSKPTSAWQSGAYTHFSCFTIVIYRQFVQIGKWTPPKSWILFNWVFAFLGGGLRLRSLAPRFSCHRVYSLSNEESEEEVLPHSFDFLCPFLDRSVESACCYGKPIRAPGADEVIIIWVINVGFAVWLDGDDTVSIGTAFSIGEAW